MIILLINKIRHYLFLLLIFLLPTQLGKHFWPLWSLVNGVRVDYLSPTLYITDILIAILFILSFWRTQESGIITQSHNSKLKTTINLVIFLAAFSIILVVNFSFPSLIKAIKIIEIIVFVYLIKIHLTKKTYPQFIFVLSLSLLFQSGLAMAQFFNHGSLNGIFYWFGERNFSGSTLGVANASINGQLILRPYGTFSHPNVLAGFLLIGIILALSSLPRIFLRDKLRSESQSLKQYNNYFLWFVVVISTFALFLTLSRVAILLWVVFLIIYLFKFPASRQGGHIKNSRLLMLISIIVVIFIFLQPRFLSIFGEDKESYKDRVAQSKIAVAMFRDHPLVGAGLNQYLVQLPKYMKINSFKEYQPVHNIFLLILSETGLAGIIVILSYCYIVIKKIFVNNVTVKQYNNLFLIIVILTLSLFDHYFYTLQQGNLMVGLIIGLCASKF